MFRSPIKYVAPVVRTFVSTQRRPTHDLINSIRQDEYKRIAAVLKREITVVADQPLSEFVHPSSPMFKLMVDEHKRPVSSQDWCEITAALVFLQNERMPYRSLDVKIFNEWTPDPDRIRQFILECGSAAQLLDWAVRILQKA